MIGNHTKKIAHNFKGDAIEQYAIKQDERINHEKTIVRNNG
jgi:hypothetical protein